MTDTKLPPPDGIQVIFDYGTLRLGKQGMLIRREIALTPRLVDPERRILDYALPYGHTHYAKDACANGIPGLITICVVFWWRTGPELRYETTFQEGKPLPFTRESCVPV